MRKLLLNLMLVTALLLTACSQASPPPNQPAPGTTANPTAAVQKPAATEPGTAAKPLATVDVNAAKMECQVVSLSPTQGPTEVSMFPPPSKDDWILGKNPGAPLTLTEYSDFQ
jgi:hypothetical protein